MALTLVSCAPKGTEPSPLPEQSAGAPEINLAQTFFQYLEDNSILYVDVSDANRLLFPNTTIYQGEAGEITMLCMSGDETSALRMWQELYDSAISADSNEFLVTKVPEITDNPPKSVKAFVNGLYYRCDIVHDVCLYTYSPNQEDIAVMDELFLNIGFPK